MDRRGIRPPYRVTHPHGLPALLAFRSAVLFCALLCCVVLCRVCVLCWLVRAPLPQDFNPLIPTLSSSTSLASLPDLPRGAWATPEGQRQLHQQQLQEQQGQQVFASAGQGPLQPRPQPVVGGSSSATTAASSSSNKRGNWSLDDTRVSFGARVTHTWAHTHCSASILCCGAPNCGIMENWGVEFEKVAVIPGPVLRRCQQHAA